MDAPLDNYLIPLMESCGYSVKSLLGHGGFGSVYLCRRSDTDESVAVKAIKIKDAKNGQEEVEVLRQLKKLDADKHNLVRFIRHLELQGHFFLEFEKLDVTLRDFLKHSSRPLYLSEIREITQQMLVALDTLKSIRMVHADVELDNIMLINHQRHPFKVKLIDFGMSLDVSKLCPGDIFQDLEHRAPEILLGLPLSEAVDMWALGSLIASVYICASLYSGNCELENIADIVQLHGLPDDHLLNYGIYTTKYFYKDSQWRLKTECSCSLRSGSSWNSWRSQSSSNSLRSGRSRRSDGSWNSWRSGSSETSDTSSSSNEQPEVHQLVTDTWLITRMDDIVKSRPGTAGLKDTQAFIGLLKEMLQVDPEKRVNPGDALRHPFITMKDFPSDSIIESSAHENISDISPVLLVSASSHHSTDEEISVTEGNHRFKSRNQN